ncbi:sugar transferase [Parafrigoribacterium humi]|jgi:lipopolysaccharide/colanic/teichoic acid biosynthesis glycosyltransferase|uniref:sugar transferase n=1 Tax=Parafrigoribacterium humi TaxID=3144664 RepID=UPI0032EABA81
MKSRRERRRYDGVKRGLDVFGAVVGLIVLSPALAVVAVLVLMKLGRPVLFKQERPGKDGQIFQMYKFRSMKNVDVAHDLNTDAQRLTAFGRKLRSTSIDELPTLVNVLKGDMSLVGPRPLLVKYLDRYTAEQARRHEVRPGVTGLAQVMGRNSLSWGEKLALDVQYVQGRSFVLDAKILWLTVGSTIRRQGISAAGEATMTEFTGEQDPATSVAVVKHSGDNA